MLNAHSLARLSTPGAPTAFDFDPRTFSLVGGVICPTNLKVGHYSLSFCRYQCRQLKSMAIVFAFECAFSRGAFIFHIILWLTPIVYPRDHKSSHKSVLSVIQSNYTNNCRFTSNSFMDKYRHKLRGGQHLALIAGESRYQNKYNIKTKRN